MINRLLCATQYHYPITFFKLQNMYDWIKGCNPFINNWGIDPLSGESFLFIVGAGRSGNTLMRRVLMDRFSLFIPPETYVLSQISRYSKLARGLEWNSKVELVISTFEYHPEFDKFDIPTLRDFAIIAKQWPKEKQCINLLIIGLYRWIAAFHHIEAEMVGDKTPLNTMSLPVVSRIFPNAKYIFMLRDGADVCKSYMVAGLYTDIRDAAYRWVGSYTIWKGFKKGLAEDQYIEISYENFVLHYEDELIRIQEKIKLPARAMQLKTAPCLGDLKKTKHLRRASQEPDSSSIGKGRRSLLAEERQQIKPIINKLPVELDYQPL